MCAWHADLVDHSRHLAFERLELILRALAAVLCGLPQALEQRVHLAGLGHEKSNALVHCLRNDLVAVERRHNDRLRFQFCFLGLFQKAESVQPRQQQIHDEQSGFIFIQQ